ncbi:MAG TPA: transposase, partial [Labilithrix sp.]|nr:transposase [Labilithrix sp.]
SVTIALVEMLARFAQHVLPSRFVKIRHYGLHAASNANTRLELARQRLAAANPRTPPEPSPAQMLRRCSGD